MPFGQPVPRPFTPASIREYAPVSSGVYGVSNAGGWIYIGEADNIQEALFSHLQKAGSSLEKWQPTGFVFESCDRTRRTLRLDRLILEYEPFCNRHWERRKQLRLETEPQRERGSHWNTRR